MTTLMRVLLPASALMLIGGLAHAEPVNGTTTKCECYFDEGCPNTPEGKGACFYTTGCTEHSVGGLEKRIDGMCGWVDETGGAVSSGGSSCGSVNPGAVAKVLKAWTTAFDRAGAAGGGPVGKYSVRAYRLSHVLIPSPQCRFEIARKVMDVQVLSRSLEFLDHPAPKHNVEDHSVQDISADRCRQQLGKIASKAVQLHIIGDSARAADELSQIPEACPGGQTLSPGCEGNPDELTCLADRLRIVAKFFTTQAHDVCGDGVLAANEQCELDRDCGDEQSCKQCRCVTTFCALALCGNGTQDPAEECDDGDTADNDPCVSCRNAVCGDGVVCDDPSCTTGPFGTPEQCDPMGPAGCATCQPDCSCG